jgi:uncharacterized protein (DUF2345 family)
MSGEGWRPLAEGEVVVVKEGRIVARAADHHPAGSGGKPRPATPSSAPLLGFAAAV